LSRKRKWDYFEVEEQDKYLTEARIEAFSKANQKASEMAALNGVRIKRVINFSEYSSSYTSPYRTLLEGMGGDIASSVSLPPMEPGTEELTLQVSVTYEIE